MTTREEQKKCTAKTEVYSRIVGYFRPVQQWNRGKKEEYKDRKVYTTKEAEPQTLLASPEA